MSTTPGNDCDRQRGQQFVSRWDAALAKRMIRSLCATYRDGGGINHLDGSNMPHSEEVIGILEYMLEVLFPGYSGRHLVNRSGLEFTAGNLLNLIFRQLSEQIERALAYRCQREAFCGSRDCRRLAEDAVINLMERLPEIRGVLMTDAQAALDGDPAAKSVDEVVIAYPGLKAIAIQRLAHVLYAADIPLIPRVMGEYAHTVTGIDIHPGARIGKSFFIDHGTGVVIGETSVIGDHCKLYQGVTLGAMSFPKDARGNIIKGAKRHPNLEDHVTIYAGATILGNITIGHDSVIGGNVWLTESVPPHSHVYQESKATIRPKDAHGALDL